MIKGETPELSAGQRAAFDDQHRARGSAPLGMVITTDAAGVRTLAWTCDLWPLDTKEALNIRGALATMSFYADVSDQRYAHGCRNDRNPGGPAAVDRLAAAIRAAMVGFLQ